jgi:hypothetical protein
MTSHAIEVAIAEDVFCHSRMRTHAHMREWEITPGIF